MDALSNLGEVALDIVQVGGNVTLSLGWTALLATIVLGLWISRDVWLRPCAEAFIGQVNLPDPRDVTCGCVSCGWCIMNACCPIVCPKFHPPFRLRVVLVQAKRLPQECLAGGDGGMRVYAQVTVAGNPSKTTSAVRCSPRGPGGGAAVAWHEPVDLTMYPSNTELKIDLVDAASGKTFASVTVPVDSFYESPGSLTDVPWCGVYQCPRLWSTHFGAEYKWPFVRGAPSLEELGMHLADQESAGCLGGCCGASAPTANHELRLERRAALQTHTARQGEKAFALSSVQGNGMELAHLPEHLRSDRDVVLVAVRENGEAIQFASPEMQADIEVQRVAARAPAPMVLALHAASGEDAGRLWAYFVMHGLEEDEDLPGAGLLPVGAA